WIELPEAARLAQPRHGHVHGFPLAQCAEAYVSLRRIRVAFHRAGRAPLVRRGEKVGGSRGSDEIGNAAARARERGRVTVFQQSPDPLADALLVAVSLRHPQAGSAPSSASSSYDPKAAWRSAATSSSGSSSARGARGSSIESAARAQIS